VTAFPVATGLGVVGMTGHGDLAAGEIDAAVVGVLAVARRETLLLATALQRGDEDAVFVAAGRLRWSLASALQFAARSHAGLLRARGRLVAAQEAAERWLPQGAWEGLAPERLLRVLEELRAPSLGLRPICADDTFLVGFDLDGLPLTGITLRGATVARVTARGARLDSADAARASVVRSCFDAASLRLAVIDAASLEECEFSRANLEGTAWRNARASRCTARGAIWLNARLDGGRFEDCDFRDSDFQAAPHATCCAAFVRCDLRGVNLEGRDLSRFSFLDCKLYGVHGNVTGLRDVVIEGADLSQTGDGSRIVSKAELLTRWSQDALTTAIPLGGFARESNE
jgi:uncharacterized protein YjbI with pentapeptide repeats